MHRDLDYYFIMCKTYYNIPNIVWLRVTDYMHAWLQRELGSEVMIGCQRVVCLQHLPGAKEAMKMETIVGAEQQKPATGSISAVVYNCIDAGLRLDPETITREYGVTREDLQLYMPVETPKMCLTSEGMLRPWTLDRAMGREQTAAVLRVIRQAFWQAVEDYNQQYSKRHPGKQYAAVEMIEAFCGETRTPDTYVEAMRREWQRRVKRGETRQSAIQGIQTDGKAVRITQLI